MLCGHCGHILEQLGDLEVNNHSQKHRDMHWHYIHMYVYSKMVVHGCLTVEVAILGLPSVCKNSVTKYTVGVSNNWCDIHYSHAPSHTFVLLLKRIRNCAIIAMQRYVIGAGT